MDREPNFRSSRAELEKIRRTITAGMRQAMREATASPITSRERCDVLKRTAMHVSNRVPLELWERLVGRAFERGAGADVIEVVAGMVQKAFVEYLDARPG
jgi:hypothetical protein